MDYGLRLRQDGVPADQDIVFYGFELTGFDVLGEGRFTAMTEVEYDDQPHAVSLDFTFDQLEAIIDRAPVGIATWLEGELARDPNPPRSLDFDRDGNLWLATREGNQVFKLDRRAGRTEN